MENNLENEGKIFIPKVGNILTGTVVKVTDDEVLVDVGFMCEGTIYKEYLSKEKIKSAKDLFKVGDEITAKVTKISVGDESSVLLLSRLDLEKQAAMDKYRQDLEIGKNVVAKVKKAVKGGLLLDYNTIELFLPDSLLSLENTNEEAKKALVKSEIEVRVIDIRNDRNREKFIVNRKQVLYDNLKKRERDEIGDFEVGQIVKGKVTRIMEYGAFVKIGEYAEGLVHISEISHSRTKKVEDVLKEGDEVEAKIIKISGKRVSLSIKATQKTPWDTFMENHKLGDKVTGKVIKKMQYGMLLEIDKDTKGLLNRIDYSWDPNDNLAGRLEVGDSIEVEITGINEEKQQFTLSRKHLEYNPWADLKLKVGEQVSATVKTILERGAVLEVSGVEAFLPIREISSDHINRVEDVLKVGDILTVEVTSFYPREWKMSVSLRKLNEKNQRSEYESHLKENVSANQSLAELFEKYKK
ncbi:MAG TPA: S1 RNA-binding domain-containing protein [Bacillota bacterium]|nr:S1 RNA-binding domain-containing protein [Bacillota bacterium]HPF42880.1 S1 RNA-binding domain-containing protein [Bacillota bacterium]HPJ85367.1 S1 RNA-binding domain-containing protein [Bacillota bacterium]HPQ61337.1 S1 RNA-binding domain-containing protein [Bacillota bacterium]HRX91944.1 S1 RNA-binding domain-containing protein [Candidatus Izemoplasmatales bacterium]